MQSFKEFELESWEDVALNYHKSFSAITSSVASILVDRAAIQPKNKLLDVACGPGYAGAYAFDKGAEVVGVDFSISMIEEAKIINPKIRFQVMDAEELELPSNSFDIILSNFGIPHFANPERAFREAFRVLKPGGQFLFTIWDKPTPFDMIFEAVQEEGKLSVSLPDGPDFFKFKDPIYSKKKFLNLGFQSIQAEQIELVWELKNSEAFFRAFYEGGVRIGGILRSQNEKAIRKIIEKLEIKMRHFKKNNQLEVPIPVILFTAKKCFSSKQPL